jgi:hypothetical protein
MDSHNTFICQDTLLVEYIDWHIKRDPKHKDAYELALQICKTEAFKLRHLQRFSRNEWKDLGIPQGIGMSLTEEIKAFERYKRIILSIMSKSRTPQS